MAEPRLRVLALPPETVGDGTVTPFILVFDRIGQQVPDWFTEEQLAVMRVSTGARTVFVFADPIEMLDSVELTRQEAEQLLPALRVSANVAT